MDDTTLTIKQQLEKLPYELREVVLSPETNQYIHSAAAHYHLNEEQQNALSNEVYFVLLGLESPSDFARNMQRELQISSQIEVPLTKEMQQRIFLPVQDVLADFLSSQAEAEEADDSRPEHRMHSNAPRYTAETDEEEARPQRPEEKARPFNTDPYREPLQ